MPALLDVTVGHCGQEWHPTPISFIMCAMPRHAHTLLCQPHLIAHDLLLLLMQAELHGIMPASDGQFEGLQQNALRWSIRLRQGAAVCHSLTMVNKTLLAGEPMERSMFKLVEAHFLVRTLTSSVNQSQGEETERKQA